VEESLENLEYFNVTNLGRLRTDQQNCTLQEARKSTYADVPAANSRPKWVSKPDTDQSF
jgi:hypothetical protein